MTIHAPELYTRKRHAMYSARAEAHLRANPGIDPALLALDLNLTERFVRLFQRKLGLRPFSTSNPNSKVKPR